MQFKEQVSDFGAYCVEQWLTGRHTETAYEYLGIDFLRQFGSRTGTRGSDDLMAQPTRNVFDGSQGGLSRVGAESSDIKRFEESFLLRDKRTPKIDRVILILYYVWGFHLREIGDVLGVSEARISQMHDKALRKQKEIIQKTPNARPKTKRRSK